MISRGGLHNPEDVLRFPLLHLDDRRDWGRWLEAAGVPGERRRRRRSCFGDRARAILAKSSYSKADPPSGQPVNPPPAGIQVFKPTYNIQPPVVSHAVLVARRSTLLKSLPPQQPRTWLLLHHQRPERSRRPR